MLKLKVEIPNSSNGTPQSVEFETFVVPLGVDEFESEIGEDEGSSGESKAPIVSYPQRQESIATSRPKRDTWKPARYTNIIAFALSIIDDNIPSTYKEAIRVPKSGEWKKAIDKEINSLHKTNIWDLVPLPKNKKK